MDLASILTWTVALLKSQELTDDTGATDADGGAEAFAWAIGGNLQNLAFMSYGIFYSCHDFSVITEWRKDLTIILREFLYSEVLTEMGY